MAKKKAGKMKSKKDLGAVLQSFFQTNPSQTFSFKQIFKMLKLKTHPEKMLAIDIMEEMAWDDFLTKVSENAYRLNTKTQLQEGVFRRKTNGKNSFIPDDGSQPIFVAERNSMSALDGDRVQVAFMARRTRHMKEAMVTAILQRARETFVGKLIVEGDIAFLQPQDNLLPYDILISKNKLKGGTTGEKAVVKIIQWPDDSHKNMIGEVVDVLGEQGNNDVEMHAILAQYGLPYRYPKHVEEAAEKISAEITEQDLAEREDFRDVFTCTIDPKDAKDFDDALSIKFLGVQEFRSFSPPLNNTSGVQTSPSDASNSSTCQLVNLSTEIKEGLYSLISNVLFVRERKNKDMYHPRIGVQSDYIYEALYDCDKQAFDKLYVDYFYRRNNHFWYKEAMKKLPRLTEATRMLVCAEDLGMVPDCVPWVMDELRILSLEIQSMPKDPMVEFGYLHRNPYRSVATISTHDMSTLRQWWDEDNVRTQKYYNNMLHRGDAAPHPLPGWLAKDIVAQHLMCPSMLSLLSLQDWLAIDEQLRLPDANAERINIPANPRHYWRYRMHLTIEELLKADDFNNEVCEMIRQSGR